MAQITEDKNRPSRKKKIHPVITKLKLYLEKYGHIINLSTQYADLLRYSEAIPLLNLNKEDTLWRTVFYPEQEYAEMARDLKTMYAYLKTFGNVEVIKHLSISRIDFCTFGNTHPFRIRIINRLNDNYDHFYIKMADASRIYGIELENLISPNKLDYFLNDNTLIEEHIAGIPGDDFMKKYLNDNVFNQIRMAKEFVKFNERCFVRLLGDMRAYNFVVDITPDIEGSQYRIRAIDFDQQSYEGRKSFYLPQYFKDNNPLINLGLKHIKAQAVKQYQMEEHSLMAGRVMRSHQRLQELFTIMAQDNISTPEKINQLKAELNHHHKTEAFSACKSMGDVVRTNFEFVLEKDLKKDFNL